MKWKTMTERLILDRELNNKASSCISSFSHVSTFSQQQWFDLEFHLIPRELLSTLHQKCRYQAGFVGRFVVMVFPNWT